MSIRAFQQALCDLIASPDLCLTVRVDGSEFLNRYDLSQRERVRLLDVVWQRGMSTNCTLYRSNRVTPIYTLLNSTCVLLSDRLKPILDAYWANTELPDLQFKHEIYRFAAFLKRQVADGLIRDKLIEEVLDFELVVNDLRFAPRRRILRHLNEAQAINRKEYQLHPLLRVARFSHDPEEVLIDLAHGRLPKKREKLEAYLLLSAVNEALETKRVDIHLGRRLWAIQAGEIVDLNDADSLALLSGGFLCLVIGPNFPYSRSTGVFPFEGNDRTRALHD